MFQKPSESHWRGSAHQETVEHLQHVFTVPLQILTINQALGMPKMTNTKGKMWRMLDGQICSRCTRNAPQFGTSQNTATGWRYPTEKGSLQASHPRTACRSAVPRPCVSLGGQCDRGCSGAARNSSVLRRAALNWEGKKRNRTMQMCVQCYGTLENTPFEHCNVDNYKTDTTLEEKNWFGWHLSFHEVNSLSTPPQTIPESFLLISGNLIEKSLYHF